MSIELSMYCEGYTDLVDPDIDTDSRKVRKRNRGHADSVSSINFLRLLYRRCIALELLDVAHRLGAHQMVRTQSEVREGAALTLSAEDKL